MMRLRQLSRIITTVSQVDVHTLPYFVLAFDWNQWKPNAIFFDKS